MRLQGIGVSSSVRVLFGAASAIVDDHVPVLDLVLLLIRPWPFWLKEACVQPWISKLMLPV